MASERSGYQANPQPSAFSTERMLNALMETLATIGLAKDMPINSHMAGPRFGGAEHSST